MKYIATLFIWLMISGFVLAGQETPQPFELINQRLSYMEDVALYKAQNNKTVEDQGQESMILEKALLKAREAGLEPNSIAGFFQAQMDAAKAIQYRYLADWLSISPKVSKSEDLSTVIRPALVQLGNKITVSISQYLKEGGTFQNNQLDEFMSVINVEHLKDSDKRQLFQKLQKIKIIK